MGLCSSCPHPGGEKLTRRMAVLSCFKPGQRVLDLGCGDGGTIRLLRDLGMEAVGLEIYPDRCDGENVLCYDGRTIPFPDDCFDGVVMECVLSCLEDPVVTLRELWRITKPEGTLAVSDLAARKGEDGTVPLSPISDGDGSFPPSEDPAASSALLSADEYRALFRQAGFAVYYEEDASEGLIQLFGQLLLEGGEEAVQQSLGLTREERRRLKPGYHLWILVPDRYEELAERTKDLPFTTEEALTGSRPRLLSAEPKDIARIITVDTSGSTGEKKRIWFTDADLQKTADFFTAGMAPMVREGYRVTVFMRGSGTYSIAGLLKIAVERLGGSVENYGEVTDLEEAAAAASQADCLVMLPGDAAALAALHPKLRPKSVLLSADIVPKGMEERLRKVWNCRVFLHWGMTETGYGGAVTGSDGGPYRLRRDLFAEIIDPETGKRLPLGEQGEIVITTLRREGMPLTRYRTGDIGKLTRTEGGMPALTDLGGRLKGEKTLPDGQKISIPILDEILFTVPGLAGYRAALKADGTLRLGLLAAAPWPEVEERTEAALRQQFGNMKTEIYPAAFRSGKRRLESEDEDRSDL